jgi:quercetin dioxygenase-like cupin family protein
VAEVAATAFASDELVNGTFELAAGGMATRVKLAALMGRHAGREVTAVDVDPAVALNGMPDGFEKDGLQAMFADYTAYGFHGGNRLVLRTIPGRTPRSLDASSPNSPVNPTAPGDSMPDQPVPVPPDDLTRKLTVARPDQDQSLPHIGLVGDTYTILVAGQDTAGRYTLIDMHVPPNGGPPPHRHDFEEMFTVLDGEVLATFRGQTMTVRAGETISIPANAPHAFTNASGAPARLLCLCAPAGQDEFFALVGQPVATRTEAPPPLSADEQAAFIQRSQRLAPEYRTELLPPPGRS